MGLGSVCTSFNLGYTLGTFIKLREFTTFFLPLLDLNGDWDLENKADYII